MRLSSRSPTRALIFDVRSLTAEESGAGKQILLERGAYKDMDVCIMYVAAPFPTLASRVAPRLLRVLAPAAGVTPWQATR